MTNYSNAVKSHEKSLNKGNNAESVDNILDNVENTPFALRGSLVKTILYFLFSFIAAAELTAALTFYTASMGLSMIVAVVICGLLAFGFHGLLHAILSDTAKGIVFGKTKESGAMANEVKTNIVLSIFLLLVAACSVFFIGKKGFTAYRSTAYEKKTEEAKSTQPKTASIDATALANKNGKIAAWKIETLTDYENAKAKNTTATTAKDESNQSRYDATTATITDIVGASAFLIELLLALLAYSIATAKLAAVREEIARRNGHTTQSVATENATKTAENVGNVATTQTVTQNVTENVTQPKEETPPSVKAKNYSLTDIINVYVSGSIEDGINGIESFSLKLTNGKKYAHIHSSKIELKEITKSEVDKWIDVNRGYDDKFFNEITLKLESQFDEKIRNFFNCECFILHFPIFNEGLIIKKEIEKTPSDEKRQFGFSENKATNGNEGRVVIKGFQRSTPQTETAIELKAKNLRVCGLESCGKEYVYGHARQVYCCEECRIAAWELKNTAKLRKSKVKA